MEMEPNREEAWVNERLAALDMDASWRPGAAEAFQRFRVRRRNRRAGKSAMFLTLAAGFALFIVADLTPRACAKPSGCEQPAASANEAAPEPAEGVPVKFMTAAQFKTEGNPKATVVIEVYSDYQCPDCSEFFRSYLPLVEEQYIKTGKVRFVHRDFPLTRHPYARLAARYANAAGEIGKYQAAIEAIFQSRDDWSLDGKIAPHLAGALTPQEMSFVEKAVASDKNLDDTVNEDMALAQKDQIMHTPTIVIVSPKNGRQVLAYNVPFETLRGYLDMLLSK